MQILIGKFALAAVFLGLIASFHSAAAAADDSADSITIALNEYQNSGVSGWATLTAKDGGLQVQMAVEGDAVTGNQPTHIHTGTCENFDPNPTFPLTTIVLDPLSSDGISETNVPDVSLDELLSGDYVILVHKSPDELTKYFVCGDLKTSNAIPAPEAGAAGTVSMGNTGSGSALSGANSGGTSSIGPALAAFALLGIALGLRVRQSRLRPGADIR
jgi:hypothetical protein